MKPAHLSPAVVRDELLKLRDRFESLDVRLRRIVKLHLAGRSLAELGRIEGVSSTRIGQLLARSLMLLTTPPKSCKPSLPYYRNGTERNPNDPTAEEIDAICREIQAGWTATERRRRGGPAALYCDQFGRMASQMVVESDIVAAANEL